MASGIYDLDFPEKIKIAVSSANYLSCYRNKCLVQSLTARWMLRRRKIASNLSFGFRKDENGRSVAHAWLAVNDFEIVSKGDGYIELQRF